MADSLALRTHMIDGQLRVNDINDERLLDAIKAIPRENFVPKAMRGFAYVDEDIDIGEGRYLMEPMIFAKMIDLARPVDGEVVLDVGCGTGYSTAVLAGLAGAVVAIEDNPTLVVSAEKKLAALDIMNVAVVESALTNGEIKQGPYDAIFIGGAVEQIPDTLLDQLKDNGRLVCVLMVNGVGRIHLAERKGDMIVAKNTDMANVMPLSGFEREKEFVF